MKKIALLLLLLPALAPFAISQKPDPKDFPIVVHVVFTRAVFTSPYQQIEAIIDGQRVELIGPSLGMLALGDYPARVTPKVHGPKKNPNSYDIYKGYEFLMPDGKLRTYQLTAMGQSKFLEPPLPALPTPPDTTPAMPDTTPPPTPPPAMPPTP
jgi:hypothetical protein